VRVRIVATWGSRRTRRRPRDDPRAEVSNDVRIGVGPVEFQLKRTVQQRDFLSDGRHNRHLEAFLLLCQFVVTV